MHGNGVKTDPHGAHCLNAYGNFLRPSPKSDVSAASLHAGNLFEGEWREGKPVVKDGSKDIGPMDWLTEAVANVSANIGGGGGGSNRGQYGRVATHDDDDR